VASWRESISPHSGGTVPDSHRVPSPRSSLVARAYHSAVSAPALTTPRSAWAAWLPVLAWAAVIFAFSSIPSLSSGLGGWDLLLRKLAHVTEYAILGALLLRATRRPGLALGLAALYAASDEVHQHFVEGRHAALVDLLIDIAGALVGVLAWSWLRARREVR
jgi:VanZ family protein